MNNNEIKEKPSEYEVLISKRQDILAEFISNLTENQFKFFKKYFPIDEAYQKRKYAELIDTILTNKKDRVSPIFFAFSFILKNYFARYIALTPGPIVLANVTDLM